MNKGFYLTLLMGTTTPRPVPRGVIDELAEVQVTTASGSASGFQLQFALGKKSVIATQLLPSGFFDPQMRVIIAVIVRGMPAVLMDGVITRQEVAPGNQPGQSILTVTGEDLTALMDLKDLSGIPYPAMSSQGQVSLILAKYSMWGIIPRVIPAMIDVGKNPVKKTPVHKGTDLNHINTLAQECGHVFYLEPGPLPGASMAYWGPEVRTGIPQPVLSVNLDAATNVESLNFSHDGMVRETKVLTIIEENSKIPIPIPVPDISLLKPSLGKQDIEIFKIKRINHGAKTNASEAASMLLGEMTKTADAVSGNGQLDVARYGHVLRARGLVAVRGAGINYNGLYYVNSVTHNIKKGEYKQSFSLVRGGKMSTLSKVAL